MGRSDGDGRKGQETERKTKPEVDGLCKGEPEGKTIVRGRCVPLGQAEGSCQKHRPHIDVGKDV